MAFPVCRGHQALRFYPLGFSVVRVVGLVRLCRRKLLLLTLFRCPARRGGTGSICGFGPSGAVSEAIRKSGLRWFVLLPSKGRPGCRGVHRRVRLPGGG